MPPFALTGVDYFFTCILLRPKENRQCVKSELTDLVEEPLISTISDADRWSGRCRSVTVVQMSRTSIKTEKCQNIDWKLQIFIEDSYRLW